MPGPTPILATHRMTFEYVSPITHKARVLCNLGPGGSGPSGLATIPRSGHSPVNAETAADALWTAIAGVFNPGQVTFGTVVFEQYASGAYIPLANYGTSVVPTGSGTTFGASQLTNFFYSTDRGRYHLDLLGVALTPADRWSSFAAAPASVQAIVTAFTTSSSDDAPRTWARTRDATFINSWLASTLALNRKSRRRLGNL